ncbi:MAG TPA: hypothetical protein VL443_20255 [Cyclobacteriaceae bacterium]|nr:hypothetical protein [Cyclobacteriaceae bacterium]
MILFVVVLFTLNLNVLPNQTGYVSNVRFRSDSTNTKVEISQSRISQKPDTLIYQSSADFGVNTMTFNNNPKLMLWMLVFALLVAVSSTLFFATMDRIITVIKSVDLKIHIIYISIACALFLILLLAFMLNGSNLKNYLSPFDFIYDLCIIFNHQAFIIIWAGEIFTAIVAASAFFGILLTNSAISKESSSSFTSEKYKQYNQDLNMFLSTFSILIVFSIILLSLIQQSIAAHLSNSNKLNLFPSEFIYGYGFIFSAILALIYIPVYQSLSSKTTAVDIKAEPKTNSFFGSFQSILSILAPLVGSGVSELIKSIS